MSLTQLALAYLRARILVTVLNTTLLALGVATIVALALFGSQLEGRVEREVRGIDLVVGAKGSPLQLILSAVFQIDAPTGNIPFEAAHELAQHPLVAQAIPLSMGDSVAGFRIVGTEPAYLDFFGAALAEGRVWSEPFEAVLGAEAARRTGLAIGDSFLGTHGLGGLGPVHADRPYKVVGILQPTARVVDRLALTPLESVWLAHEHHGEGSEHDEHGQDEHAHEEAGHEGEPENAEVTALLLRYRSPLAAVQLPRYVNSQSALQAASPALEAARLVALTGAGLEALRAFGLLLVASAGLGIFVALMNALEDRRHDLAIMRALGATPGLLVREMLLEALILGGTGTVLGLVLGHAAVAAGGRLIPDLGAMGLTGLSFVQSEWLLVAGTALLALLAASIPAIRAYRSDVVGVLARGA